MKIIVMSCPKYQHLIPGFIERYNKFWKDDLLVDIAGEDESWSSQLIRICNSISDPYIVRLCEDFWITNFNRTAFNKAKDLAMLLETDRIGLQSIIDYVPPCTEPFSSGFERMKPGSDYMCSLEASIYRRQFLLDNLVPGKHIWETEVDMSKKAANAFVLIPTTRILEYTDATRRGQSRVDGMPNIEL